MNLALPGLETESVCGDDIVFTPVHVARDIVNHFQPTGRILDPCRGRGAFADLIPGCEWCEIREGKDFYNWTEPVDWIVSNPPYSIFSDFLRHSFTVAENIVYLIPVNKVFNSDRMMREIWKWGGGTGDLCGGRWWRAQFSDWILYWGCSFQTWISGRNEVYV